MEKSTVPLDVGRSGHLPLTECATKKLVRQQYDCPRDYEGELQVTQFFLKLLALLLMTADHIGFVFGPQGWGVLPADSAVLRTLGRASFPLFAFCLAQGWHKTHDRTRYFGNLAAGAAAAQIPFTMAFSASNFIPATEKASVFWIELPCLFFAMVAVGIYWRFVTHRHLRRDLLLVAVTALIPGVRWQVRGFWILGEHTNVFYTFLVAFFCLYVLSCRERWKRADRLLLFCAAPILLMGYGLPADYGTGLMGVVLIVGFAFLSDKVQQALFLALWSVVFYGILAGNFVNALFCAAACIPILLYDQQGKGRIRAKKLFYWYYPAHLFVLGMINGMIWCQNRI